MHYAVPVLRRMSLVRIWRFYFQIGDSLEWAVVRNWYPQFNLVGACGNVFDRGAVFKLETALVWSRWPRRYIDEQRQRQHRAKRGAQNHARSRFHYSS